jgi:DNA-directed RNA polymerase specialized sigma24 family protein
MEASRETLPSAVLEQLMVRYQQADAVATTALIEQLSPQLYRFFAAQLGNREDASDMLQDAWLRIHRVRHTYRAWRAAAAVGLRHRTLRSGGQLSEAPPHRGAGSCG